MPCCGRRQLYKFRVDDRIIARKQRGTFQQVIEDLLSSYPAAKYIELIEPTQKVIKDETAGND